jgi:hypothetical protein
LYERLAVLTDIGRFVKIEEKATTRRQQIAAQPTISMSHPRHPL